MKKYSGELKVIGNARIEMQHGVSKYSVLEIGDNIIKKVSANEIISTYLSKGNNLDLYVGPLFFSKYVYALNREDGSIVKMGIGLFALSLIIKIIISLMFLALMSVVGGSIYTVSIVFCLYLLFRSGIAIKNYASIR